ncbi:MAG: hypothetical protein NWE98_00760 [Candidatus Bathyarchaeota archaeon]|nr:hypothetical protein [Candidatus Bathyarchaeota archaeon]
MKYVTLYSDNNGDSHFKDVEVEFEHINFAPPAPPVELSKYIAANRFVFFRTPPGWYGDWHPPPKEQFCCCISARFEVTANDS